MCSKVQLHGLKTQTLSISFLEESVKHDAKSCNARKRGQREQEGEVTVADQVVHQKHCNCNC